MTAHGAAAQPLASPSCGGHRGSTNGRIAFDLYRPRTQDSALYSVRADGSRPKRLLVSRARLDPEYSPDGKEIVFVGEASLWRIRSTGGQPAKVFDFGSLQLTSAPVWAPSGLAIAFIARPAKYGYFDGRLYLLRLGTRRMQRVATLPLYGEDPSWSPDSRTLLVSGRHGIYEISVQTGRSERLIYDDDARAARWSPDGRSVVYLHADEPCAPDIGCTDYLRTVRTSGRGDRQLAAQAEQPEWSPDGRYLLYTKQFGPALGHLFKLSVRTRKRVDLTPGRSSHTIGRPAWQPRCSR